MKGSRPLKVYLLEFLIAGAVFTGIFFMGISAFNFRIVSSQNKDSPKGIMNSSSTPKIIDAESDDQALITTPHPSREELIRQLIGAGRRGQKGDPPRPLAPWEQQVQNIQRQALSPTEKTRQLLALAQTLSGDEQARVYAAASATAPAGTFQQQLYPMVWNPSIPAPVARVLASGVVTQPDSFKFPALLSLMKHSDGETRAMAESVLWAYFPDEPTNNYPQAVQLFLRGSY